MRPDLTNLLPENRQRALTRSYFVRLAVVALGLLSIVVLANGLLLLPSYGYLIEQVHARETQLAALAAKQNDSVEKEAQARVGTLNKNAQRLVSLEATPTASASIRALLLVPRPGIAITGFTYNAAASASTTPKILVNGVAASREALRAYVQALGALPYVASATLPISAYAKETNIDFTISLSGAFVP